MSRININKTHKANMGKIAKVESGLIKTRVVIELNKGVFLVTTKETTAQAQEKIQYKNNEYSKFIKSIKNPVLRFLDKQSLQNNLRANFKENTKTQITKELESQRAKTKKSQNQIKAILEPESQSLTTEIQSQIKARA